MMTKDTKPAALTVCRPDSATDVNEDGNAAYVHDSTDLATIAAELARVADELHQLNRSLTITRCDGMEIIGLAQLIAENGNGRVVRR